MISLLLQTNGLEYKGKDPAKRLEIAGENLLDYLASLHSSGETSMELVEFLHQYKGMNPMHVAKRVLGPPDDDDSLSNEHYNGWQRESKVLRIILFGLGTKDDKLLGMIDPEQEHCGMTRQKEKLFNKWNQGFGESQLGLQFITLANAEDEEKPRVKMRPDNSEEVVLTEPDSVLSGISLGKDFLKEMKKLVKDQVSALGNLTGATINLGACLSTVKSKARLQELATSFGLEDSKLTDQMKGDQIDEE